MERQKLLAGFEHLVLGVVPPLKDGETGSSLASGVAVRKEIVKRTGDSVSLGAVYTTLDRLEKKGFLTSEVSDRVGNRPMRFYLLTGEGQKALLRARQAINAVWEGLEPLLQF
jgi:PadR family transcriptional regulator, regulatory protein PadR